MENTRSSIKCSFKCNRWLSKSEDDHQIIRELPAVIQGKEPLPGNKAVIKMVAKVWEKSGNFTSSQGIILELGQFLKVWEFYFWLAIRFAKVFSCLPEVMSIQTIFSKKLIFVVLSLALLPKELSWVVSEDWFLDTEMPGKVEEFLGNLLGILLAVSIWVVLVSPRSKRFRFHFPPTFFSALVPVFTRSKSEKHVKALGLSHLLDRLSSGMFMYIVRFTAFLQTYHRSLSLVKSSYVMYS